MKIVRSIGKSISINNGVITINGKRVDTKDEKVISIVIKGNCEIVECDSCDTITVEGSAGSVKTMNGDVNCGTIGGNVSTMSGDVEAEKINGNVSTMSGDIVER